MKAPRPRAARARWANFPAADHLPPFACADDEIDQGLIGLACLHGSTIGLDEPDRPAGPREPKLA